MKQNNKIYFIHFKLYRDV